MLNNKLIVMKRTILTILSFLVVLSVGAQSENETLLRELENSDTLTVAKKENENVTKPEVVTITKKVEIVGNDTIITETTDTVLKSDVDTAVLRLGKRKIIIVDNKDKKTIEFPNRYDDDEVFEFREEHRFKGHWAGFEMGVNGFMDNNNSLTMSNDLEWFDLKQARSWNVNINFMQYSIGFGTDKAGLVTGLGLEFNDYHFSNPITLKVENGITVPDSSYIIAGAKVDKSKLSTVNLTLPMLLEFQIPTGEHGHRIYMSAGVIGGLNIGSHTKVKYNDGKKDKDRGDFNIATLRYGFTARLGYRGIRLFANYYPVALFEKDKGPEVYPYSIGLVLIPFD